jgi:hypothetical protein
MKRSSQNASRNSNDVLLPDKSKEDKVEMKALLIVIGFILIALAILMGYEITRGASDSGGLGSLAGGLSITGGLCFLAAALWRRQV